MKATITTLQRLSIHDGPGIRTVIFFKGCNMHCKWCHNPETWINVQQLQYFEEKCICCGTCIDACSTGALSVGVRKISIDHTLCTHCGICTEKCCSGALTLVGRKVSVEELITEIKKDYPYFCNSGGGITVSGGEPLLQHEFLLEFLIACKLEGISTAIETNLSLPWNRIEQLLPLVDYWMCDLKIADMEKHRQFTGIDNIRVIDNIGKLVEKGCSLTVRTPVVPGVNDNKNEIESICRILAPYASSIRYELLGFHTLGFNKFETLGMQNELSDKSPLDKEKLEELKKILLKYNLQL